MGTRGPKSAAELSVVQLEQQRPEPPEALPEGEKHIWRDVVDSFPPKYFKRAQFPVLVEYCRHVRRADNLARVIDDLTQGEYDLAELRQLLADAERETRAINSCARSMRITHQSQIQPRGAGTAIEKAGSGKRPWETRQ